MTPPPPHSTSSRREPGSSSSPSPKTSNPTASPSPADPSARRLSKDSEGYPSWLPKRPPPPAPASTLGAASHIHFGETPSPVDGYENFGEFGEDVFGRGADAFITGEAEENVHPGAETEADYGYSAFSYDHEHEHEIVLEPRRRPRGAQGLDTDVIGGRKPTTRSVRIVSLEDSFVETSEKGKGAAGSASREPTDQTIVGTNAGGGRAKVNAPAAARVFTRGSYPMPGNPTAFLPSSAQPMSPYAYTQGFPNALGTGHGPPIQPRFNAKNLNLQILLHPSRWMKLYFWLWPVLIFYHIPLQTFFDFNTVFILIQVSKFPSSSSSRKNWALGAAAYVACWLAWILFVCVLYELIYSFTRRWRLRRPLILPIFLSSPAFNLAAMTSYANFSFLQYLRFSAFGRPEEAYLLGPNLPGANLGQETDAVADAERPDTENVDGPDRDLTGEFGEIVADEKRGGSNVNAPVSQKRQSRARFSLNLKSGLKARSNTDETKKPSGPIAWRQGLAETFFFYSQNAPTVALLLPRAGLCLAVLFAFSSAPQTSFSSSFNTNSVVDLRDSTFFRGDGSLTGYARGILIANAAWTAWRILILGISWLGLWYFSGQRLGGLCGPRHVWDEYAQEKTRARYSLATSEYEAYRASSYGGAYGGDGEQNSNYGGDELAWAWRETTRTRVQDAFEFCLMTRRMRGFSAGPGQGLRWNTPPTRQESGDTEGQRDKPKGGEEGFEGIEKVLAAVGFGAGPSPAKRGVLSKDLFSGPPPKMGALEVDSEPVPSTSKAFVPLSVNTDLEKPKMAKRNSKDKDDFGSGPIMSLPYPFSRPGAGHVSSKDSVPFPGDATSSNIPRKKSTSKTSTSTDAQTDSGTGSTESRSRSGGDDEEDEEEEEEEEEDDEEEEEEEEDEDEEDEDFEGSEEPSSGRASGSMSSLGQPISPSSRFHNPFGASRRPAGAGHGRSMSGVSSAFSSATTGGGSVATHSTGNRETADSAGAIPYPIPMPPRHPAAAAGGGRGRTGHVPVAFPSVQTRPRVHSGTGVVIDPSVYDPARQAELEVEEDDEEEDEDDDEARGEHEDSVGLLGIPTSARNSRISLANSSSSGGARSRTHSHQSVRSRTRTHSSSRGTPSSSRSISAVRERASSLGASMRSIVHSAASASLTQLDSIMRGATGPAAGLGGIGGGGSTHSSSSGSRPRSRVNSSMARLEEDVVLDLPPIYHHPLHHHDDAYSSSGGTHSRSGSESLSHLSTENYTFGRPMTFTRVPPPPSPVREQSEAPDSPVANPAAEAQVESAPQPPIAGDLAQSSQSYYSQDEGSVNPTPTGLPASVPIPIPIHISSSPADSASAVTALSSSPLSSSEDHSQSHSSERQGVPIPWSTNAPSRRSGALVPPTPNTLALPPRNSNMTTNAANTNTSSSGSPPDLSSAAGSFVTAPATLETESVTVSNNSHLSLNTVGADDAYGVWGLPIDARPRRISGTGGPLVDRPGQDMGAGGSGWHVM